MDDPLGNGQKDDAVPPDGTPQPDVVLYSRAGCGLCDEARSVLAALLARRSAAGGRPVPTLVERDLDADPAWLRAFFTEIPVVEVGDRRLTLATSPGRIELFLAEVLDG